VQALDPPAGESMVHFLWYRLVTEFENGIPVTLGREITN